MSRTPHLPQILQGPLSVRPSAAQTPEWVWYFAWDDDGGAFYRPTPGGWIKATPSVTASAWQAPSLEPGWSPLSGSPFQSRLNRGQVEFRGSVTRVAGTFPSKVATLPEGHRPPTEIRLPIVVGQGVSVLSVSADGAITVYSPVRSGDNAEQSVYLDSVRFAVGA